jgi:hypothetical protein
MYSCSTFVERLYDGDHSSEGGLEDITPDRVIVNDGSMAQLKEKIYG